MILLEYESKQILRQYDIRIPRGDMVEKLSNVTYPIVLKSQVPVGGRGKLGGVKIVEDRVEFHKTLNHLLLHDIKGLLPKTILAEEKLAIEQELYLALTINRGNNTITLMAHHGGGVDIENHPSESFFDVPLDHESNLQAVAQNLAVFFELPLQARAFEKIVEDLWLCFIKNDAVLLEINPLVLTTKGELIAADCKMELDDNAAFRHPEWDFEDKPKNTNFVTLNENGNIATIANGAGLAMATVDAVAAASLTPANFLDIGGGANEASVTKAFESILEYPHIKAIIINIFAGITRCDEVAKAIIAAKKSFPNLPPLFIRLDGTNYDEAKAILDQAHINLLPSLEDCLKAAQEVSL